MSLATPKASTLSKEEREGLHHGKGILPLAKSTKKHGVSWVLPGHGKSYFDCGKLLIFGCLNVEEHTQEGLLEKMSGKAYIEMRKRSCLRAECPICYEKWAGKEGEKIEWRLEAWSGRGKVIHVIASPKKRYNWTFPEMRAKAYSVLKKSGLIGGCMVFHPFRSREIVDEGKTEWYWSPHFHVLGYGWIHGTKKGFESHGWIVKNAGIRKTVAGTALYQLSHCGIHEKYHSTTWFGQLSYNKLKVPLKPKPEKETCPICGQVLRPLYYFGGKELPQEEGFYWMDPEGFVLKPKRWDYG